MEYLSILNLRPSIKSYDATQMKEHAHFVASCLRNPVCLQVVTFYRSLLDLI